MEELENKYERQIEYSTELSQKLDATQVSHIKMLDGNVSEL